MRVLSIDIGSPCGARLQETHSDGGYTLFVHITGARQQPSWQSEYAPPLSGVPTTYLQPALHCIKSTFFCTILMLFFFLQYRSLLQICTVQVCCTHRCSGRQHNGLREATGGPGLHCSYLLWPVTTPPNHFVFRQLENTH